MSRTYHHTDPAIARRRRALRGAKKNIEAAWTFTGWRGRPDRRMARKKVRAFLDHVRGLDGESWWSAVTNVRPWLPRWSR